MKKILATILVQSIIVFSLTGCRSDTESQSKNSSIERTTIFDWNSLENVLTEAYMGAMDNSDETLYYAGCDEYGILMAVSSDATENINFVGPIKNNENGTLTITDEESGRTLTFSVIDNGDETITMDMGDDIGTATIINCDVSKVLEAFEIFDENTKSIN